MVKVFFIVMVGVVSVVFGVDCDVKASGALSDVKRIEVEAMKKHLKETMHFIPNSDKDVERIVRENSALADAYLQEHKDKFTHALLQIELNEKLAERYVKEVYDATKISDDVLKSYYLEHLEKYRKAPLLKARIVIFASLDKAMKFYEHAASSGGTHPDKIADANRSGYERIVKYVVPVSMARPEIRAVLKKDKAHYYAPPQFYKNRFIVIYVDEIKKQEGYLPFEKVKANIVHSLKESTMLKKRHELVEALTKEER